MAHDPRAALPARFFAALLLLALAFTLYLMAPYLLSLFMGGVLALLSEPLHHRLERRLPPRTAAAAVTAAGVLLVLAPLGLFFAAAVQQGLALQERLTPEGLSVASLLNRLPDIEPLRWLIGDPQSLEKKLHDVLQGGAKAGAGVLLKLAANVPEVLLQLALACMAWFFFLKDGRRLFRWLAERLPLDEDVRLDLYRSIKDTAVLSLWATAAAAAAQAAVIAVGFLLLGVPGPFFAAAATFILAWIPVVGSVPVAAAGAVYLYVTGTTTKVVLMLVVAVAAGLIDNVVRPLVLRGRDQLHPLLILVAIFGGISRFGLLGVFVGPVIAAVLLCLLELAPALTRRFGVSLRTGHHP